jgi:uncharacterized small protein (DUF1192 family)
MLLLLWWGVQYGQRTAQSPLGSARQALGNASTPEEQIAALKAELASVQAQQQAIAHEIARLEAERGAQPTDAAPLPPAETPGAARGPQHA